MAQKKWNIELKIYIEKFPKQIGGSIHLFCVIEQEESLHSKNNFKKQNNNGQRMKNKPTK